MYSDHDRRASVRRADDEFLRRMIGGELAGCSLPTMSDARPMLPDYSSGDRTRCDGSPAKPHKETADGCSSCPDSVSAPALAMVYAPRQCWRETFDEERALACGTLFAELYLPFEGCCKKTGEEGYPCR